MTSISEKVRHVRAARQTRRHHCHWPDCEKQVPPAMWGCRQHWYMLPPLLRARIWQTYRLGQEEAGRAGADYIAAAKAAQQWIAENFPPVRALNRLAVP